MPKKDGSLTKREKEALKDFAEIQAIYWLIVRFTIEPNETVELLNQITAPITNLLQESVFREGESNAI